MLQKKRPSLRKKGKPFAFLKKGIGRGLFLGVVLFVVYIFLFGDYGVYRMWKQNKEIAELQRTIEALRLEQEGLKQEIYLLENDPEYIEKIAREKYGMIKEGEIIYKIVRSQKEEPGKDHEAENEPSDEERSGNF
jgi:cell division protein FtsB